ncbi:dipeptide-binding ABC transporter, periplasmic substrate-binding component [Geomicrobium sp. JCM 19039]|nr:dipeptide-binding ABC transporter, periplasmic substrate-binding component [Geomicrobium sp. JCM 19039]
MFESWQENSKITLQRNDEYQWGPPIAENQGTPHLDTLSFYIIPEESSRIGSVQSNEVLAAETVPPQNVDALEGNPDIDLLSAESTGIPFTLMFNQNHEPWDEYEARKAVQLALDLDSIVDSLYLGQYERADAPLTPGTPGQLIEKRMIKTLKKRIAC